MKINQFSSFFCRLTIVSAITLVSMYAAVAEQSVDSETRPSGVLRSSFSAEYRYLHEPSDTLLDSARVNVSDVGLRVDQTIDNAGNALIANFETNQLWFLDSQRELVHQVPVVAVEAHQNIEAGPAQAWLPGFIRLQPCNGLRAVFAEEVTVRGRRLSRWQCFLDSDEMLQEQLFSPGLGVVLWSRDTDGFINELVDVRLNTPNPGIFKPPSNYRVVEINELINGYSPIEHYQDVELGLQHNNLD